MNDTTKTLRSVAMDLAWACHLLIDETSVLTSAEDWKAEMAAALKRDDRVRAAALMLIQQIREGQLGEAATALEAFFVTELHAAVLPRKAFEDLVERFASDPRLEGLVAKPRRVH